MLIFLSDPKFDHEAFQIQVSRFLVVVEALSEHNRAPDRFE